MKMQISPTNIHYEYNTRGYMIYYKGQPIGGAGILKSAKGCKANLKLFREQAEMTKRQICAGYIDEYMQTQILKIEKEKAN